MSELEVLVHDSVMEVNKNLESCALFVALDFARKDMEDALESLRGAAFGVVDHKNTKGRWASTLKVEKGKLERAKVAYAKALHVYNCFNKCALATLP